MEVDGRLEWFRPDPRAIFELERFHVPRRLARLVRQRPFELRIDAAFREVMEACAVRPEGSWISARLVQAYCRLQSQGFAHSLEAWREGSLVGGIYGVSLGAAFMGESMFSRVSNASKVCLVELIAHLRRRGYQFCDIQFVNPHLKQFKPRHISAHLYERRLARALRQPCRFVACLA